MALDYSDLTIRYVTLIADGDVFQLKLGDAVTAGPNAVQLRFAMFGDPAVSTLEIGISHLKGDWNAIVANSPRNRKVFLEFLLLIARATVLDQLPVVMNALARFMGDDAEITTGIVSLAYVWNDTDFEWTFPDPPSKSAANDPLVTLERAALASIYYVMSNVLLELEKEDFITAVQWFCDRQTAVLDQLSPVMTDDKSPRPTLRLVPPPEG